MPPKLDSTGLTIQSLAEIRAEMNVDFRAAFGSGALLGDDTDEGKIIGIIAERAALDHQLAQAIYDAMDPTGASGVSLERIAAITTVTRNPATSSDVDLYLAGTPATVIPLGTLAAVVDAGDQFQTTIAAVLGSIGNITLSGITRAGSTATGTSVAHGFSVDDWIFITGADEDEYNGLFQIDAVPTPDTFEYEVSGTPTSPDPHTGTIEGDEATPVAAESVETGPVQGLANTITTIVNAISGWDRVENFVDAALGLDEETDAALRTRRENALAGLGNATVEAIRADLLLVTGVTQAFVFENDTGLTVGSRPPHSVEAVVEGGDSNEVATALFNSKAGGIATFGTETAESVTDSQGTVHSVLFSRPTPRDIWLEIDFTVDGTFPTDGLDQAETAILAFGNALNIGDDVIVFPSLVASVSEIPGILDMVIRIADTASGGGDPSPTLDNNITIDETEVSVWSSSRLTFTV